VGSQACTDGNCVETRTYANYVGPVTGAHDFQTGDPLVLATAGAYTLTFNRAANVRIKGVAGGGGGQTGPTGFGVGGRGGGGGASNIVGVLVSVVKGTSYAVSVGAEGPTGLDGGETLFRVVGGAIHLQLGGGKGGAPPGEGAGGLVIIGDGTPGGAGGLRGLRDDTGGIGAEAGGAAGGGGGGGCGDVDPPDPGGTGGFGGTSVNQGGGVPTSGHASMTMAAGSASGAGGAAAGNGVTICGFGGNGGGGGGRSLGGIFAGGGGGAGGAGCVCTGGVGGKGGRGVLVLAAE
jgi:hypothetical protein